MTRFFTVLLCFLVDPATFGDLILPWEQRDCLLMEKKRISEFVAFYYLIQSVNINILSFDFSSQTA